MRTIAHSLGLTNHFGSDTQNTTQKESLASIIICRYIVVNPSFSRARPISLWSLTAHASGDDHQLVIDRQIQIQPIIAVRNMHL